MSKYIDAEKLKAELKKLSESDNPIEYNSMEKSAYNCALYDVEYLITSLQQEQPGFPTTDKEVENFLASHPKVELPDKYKTPDWLLKQEQPKPFSCSHENGSEPKLEGIEAVVHHYAKVHYLETNTEQLNARLKQFDEGSKVLVYIEARKED